MLLVWVYIPLALGLRIHTKDKFNAMQKSPFHRLLFLTDTTPLESQTAFELKGDTKRSDESLGRGELETDVSKTHYLDSGKKGHSDKEKHTRTYGEQAGKEGKFSAKGGVSSGHHSSTAKDYSHKFKDRLLHKSGNYEKGYHDKYHLDEVVKHDKFWNNHHSHEQFDKYGQHGSSFHKARDGHVGNKHKQAANENVDGGTKGETAEGHSTSEHKGHKSKGGAKSKYENKGEYKKEDEKKVLK